MCYLPILCLLSLCLGGVLCFVCEDDIWKNCKMRAEMGECEVREDYWKQDLVFSVRLLFGLIPDPLYFIP